MTPGEAADTVRMTPGEAADTVRMTPGEAADTVRIPRIAEADPFGLGGISPAPVQSGLGPGVVRDAGQAGGSLADILVDLAGGS